MTSTRPRSAFVVPLFLLVAFLMSPRAGAAATWAWPSFDCLQTLQNCIDVALPGDVVEVASHGPISETLTIQNESLTLRPQSGFFPVLTANQSIVVMGGVTG